MGSLIEYKWLFNRVGFEQKSSFPPFNIFSADETFRNITIELALAGYSKDNLSITCDEDKLKIVGTSDQKEDNFSYIARNIANRSFTKEFVITKYHVSDCIFENGMLSICLERDDSKDTKVIEIN